MPTCTLPPLNGMWPSSESLHSTSSGFHSPGSPSSMTPISASPDSTLKRRTRCVSASERSWSSSPLPGAEEAPPSAWVGLVGWYPLFLLRVAKALLLAALPALGSWRQLLLAAPALWASACTWCACQLLRPPLAALRLLVGVALGARAYPRRTVLISGGGSVQALHLARILYAAGARVVAVEVAGEPALARFSTAVARFHRVPRPTADRHQHYVRALCRIAHRERAALYVPVAASTPAYFDAVAKPHLELLGCACFGPGIQEVRALDDVLDLLRRCERAALPTPAYRTLAAGEDPSALWMARDQQRPRAHVDDVAGEHYVTCTTVRESRVLANVTCRVDGQQRLRPVAQRAVDEWLARFLDQLRHQQLRPITGHISFRLAQCADTGAIKPLSARVGLSLPYVCYTRAHARLLWKPCRHLGRQRSGPLAADSALEGATRLSNAALDKRDALFALWDPLPYCVHYHMQLPLRRVLDLLRRAQPTFPLPTGVN